MRQGGRGVWQTADSLSSIYPLTKTSLGKSQNSLAPRLATSMHSLTSTPQSSIQMAGMMWKVMLGWSAPSCRRGVAFCLCEPLTDRSIRCVRVGQIVRRLAVIIGWRIVGRWEEGAAEARGNGATRELSLWARRDRAAWRERAVSVVLLVALQRGRENAEEVQVGDRAHEVPISRSYVVGHAGF